MGAQWIANEKDLARAYVRMGRHLLGGKGQAVPQIDFKVDAILLVAMGQKMTGGYAIKMSAEPVIIDGQTATLKLRWVKPKRGGMTIQILTNPCILIKMSKGDYTHVKVLDQFGALRAELKL